MADDFDRRLEEEATIKNPAGVLECLVDPKRRMVRVEFAHADNLEAISDTLVGRIRPKALPLILFFRKQQESFELPGYAQGGLTRREIIQTSLIGSATYSVVPVTAKHNLRQDLGYHLVSAKIQVPSVGQTDMRSPDFNWLPTLNDRVELRPDRENSMVYCEWGFDVSVGELIDSPPHPFTHRSYSFSLVRETFTLEKGQKVGIAVKFSKESKPTDTTIVGVAEKYIQISEKEIEEIYGLPDTVNIYTGEITHVGATYIEYDFNAFTGCSGAVVFLLDMNQPTSVQECDFGKAIAVHSGAHPFLADRNYGFIIRHHTAFSC